MKYLIVLALLIVSCHENRISVLDENGNSPFNLAWKKITDDKYAPILNHQMGCLGEDLKLSDTLFFDLSSEYHSITIGENGKNTYSFIVHDALNNHSYWYKVTEVRSGNEAVVTFISDNDNNCQLTFNFKLIKGIWEIVDNNKVNENKPEPFLEVNQRFVDTIFDYSITRKSLLDAFGSELVFIYQPKVNNHMENTIDTFCEITTITEPRNTYEMYILSNKEMFYGATFQSKGFSLKENLFNGMNKSDFKKILNIDTYADCIKITSETQLNSWIFYFENDKLVKIVYDGYLD